jgi:hypothetical protein
MRTYFTHNNAPEDIIVMKQFGVYFLGCPYSILYRTIHKPTRNHWVRIDKDTQENEKWRAGLEPLTDEQLETMYFMEDL